MLCDSSGGFGCVLARMKDITLCALSSRYCHLGMEVSSMQSVRRRNQKNTMNVREDYDFRKNIYFQLCVCSWVCVVYVSLGVHRGQKRVFNTLELELQAIVSHLMSVLGTNLGFSAESALCAFNQ